MKKKMNSLLDNHLKLNNIYSTNDSDRLEVIWNMSFYLGEKY